MIGVSAPIQTLNALFEEYRDLNNELAELDARHAKALTEVDRECRYRIQEITNGKNRAITQAKSGKTARNVALSAMASRVDELKQSKSIDFESDSTETEFSDEDLKEFDWQELEDMAVRVSDDTLLGRLKGLFHSGGYMPRGEMVSEYEKSLSRAEAYIDYQRVMADQTVKDVESDSATFLNAEVDRAYASRREKISNENASYENEYSIVKKKLDAIACGDKFRELASNIKREYSALAGTPSSLSNSPVCSGPLERVFFASRLSEIDVPQALQKAFREAFGPLYKYPLVKTPLSLLWPAPSIVFEASAATRLSMLSGLNSYIARLLAQSNRGDIAILYLDPLGAGTSLSKLIALCSSDENSSLRCAGDEDSITSLIDHYQQSFQTDFQDNGHGASTYTVFVLCDYPCGLSVDSLNSLESLSKNSSQVSFIVLHRMDVPSSEFADNLIETIAKGSLVVSEADGVTLIQDGDETARVALPQVEKIESRFFSSLKDALSVTSLKKSEFDIKPDVSKGTYGGSAHE